MQAILLTGASGVIGQALLKCFTDSTLFCLVRRRRVDFPNAILIHGDVSRPRLGLSREDYAEIARHIDAVVHSAAVTDFNQSQEVMTRTNIDGTHNVLQLAATAGVPLYYVGTAYSSVGQAGFAANAYELSKRAAEAAVRASGVPSVIVRPSIIVGDSTTGEIGRAQGFHFILRLLARNLLPLVPATPNAYVDFISQDLVARIIADLVKRGQTGVEYWLTQGERALTLQQVMELCIRELSRLTGRPVSTPRTIDPEIFDRLIRPVFFPALPATLRCGLDRALTFAKYFNIDRPLPTSLPSLQSELKTGPWPSLELTLVRNVERLLGHRTRVPPGLHDPRTDGIESQAYG